MCIFNDSTTLLNAICTENIYTGTFFSTSILNPEQEKKKSAPPTALEGTPIIYMHTDSYWCNTNFYLS